MNTPTQHQCPLCKDDLGANPVKDIELKDVTCWDCSVQLRFAQKILNGVGLTRCAPPPRK